MKIIKTYKKYLLGVGLTIVGFTLLSFILTNVYSPESYIEEVEKGENSYIQTKSFNEVSLKMIYQPAAYLSATSIINNPSKNDYLETKKSYSETSSYILRIETQAAGGLLKGIVSDIGSYQELVSYLSFEIKEDIIMKIGEETYPCAFVHFERNYDLAPIANIHLGFNLNDLQRKQIDREKNWTITFDAERFNLGPLHFRFDADLITEDPKIIF